MLHGWKLGNRGVFLDEEMYLFCLITKRYQVFVMLSGTHSLLQKQLSSFANLVLSKGQRNLTRTCNERREETCHQNHSIFNFISSYKFVGIELLLGFGSV